MTWLHLSDWHQRGPDFDRQVVRDALLADLRDRAKLNPALAEVDFVIFSGDAAWSGKAEEFKAAREVFFDPVMSVLTEGGQPPNKLFLVPGNHDLSRDYIEEMLPPGLQKPLDNDEQVQKWLTAPDKRARALEPFKHFTDFVTGYTSQKSAAYANTWSGFIGQKTVGILCLNSAWMCGRRKESNGEVDDYGQLVVGEAQLHEALATIQSADVRIAVMHHPFAWLKEFDRERIEDRLKRGCHFILHGHEHKPKFDFSHGLPGQCAIIPAGACFERRLATNPRYTNAYNFVHLDFDTGRGVIYLRRWSDPRNQWLADHESHDGGLFTFPLPKELATRTPTPPPPPSPAFKPADATPPAILEYLRRVEKDTEKLKLIGLGQGVQIELPIAQAYIPLNVVVSRGLQADNHFHFDDQALRQREHVEENVQLCDIFNWAARFESRGVLLLGDPGAGKTTGARQFCWRVLQERGRPRPQPGSGSGDVAAGGGARAPIPADDALALGLPPGTIPVLLRLRHVTAHHLAHGLTSFITDSVAAAALPPELANPGPHLLARQGVLWVFDGLDEVVNENARVHVCGWLKQALDQRPDDFFLVTSRYSGYQGRVDLGPGFCQFHVKPLDEPQVAEFVDHWYRAVFQRLHGLGADIAERAGNTINSLMELLRQPEYRIGRLRELPANPLMLTILCVVHHQDRNLPRRRADLYARCVRVLVEHWRKEVRDLQEISGYDPEAAEAVLAALAWWLQEKEVRMTMTAEELGVVATKALADLAPGAGLGRDGEAFIKRMRDESGILAMWSAGQCGFLHLTFQEYLAGLHAAREDRAEELVKHVGQSWWREVILVAAAIGSREFALKFFAALVQGDAVAKEGAFVDQCLDEARYPVLEPFLAALTAKGAKPERQLDLLRRLKAFDRPELLAACRELAGSLHPEMASLAGEILQRAGIVVERPRIGVAGGPREQFVDPRTGMTFITIPAGEFDMGSHDHKSEKPIHRVRLTKPFRLGKYPVTNADYERFLKANPGVQPPSHWKASQFNDPQQPVVAVSWEDAQGFCQWAGCRLPTEAEWEYACRAGTQTRFSFGDDETKLGDYAWFGKNSGGKPQPVGTKLPNPWGLYDVHGSVWEWCEDWYDRYPKGPVTDPTGPATGNTRGLRGGSWGNDQPTFCSCSYRYCVLPDRQYDYVGLRVVWLGGSVS
jgi:formylglycine-generating enzyme required for sulfatase activity/predicted phosphodiesterase